jgi:hypothetical protein
MSLIDIVHEMPERRLSVNGCVAADDSHLGEKIVLLKRNMAQMLAKKIIDNDVFCKTTIKPHGFDVINYRADVIVLTEEEYRKLCLRQFQAGKDSVLGPSPHDFYKF